MHTHFEVTNLIGILGILITFIAGAIHCGVMQKPLNALLPLGAALYLIGRTSSLLNLAAINTEARGILLTIGIGMVAFGFHQLRKKLAATGSSSQKPNKPADNAGKNAEEPAEENFNLGNHHGVPEQTPAL